MSQGLYPQASELRRQAGRPPAEQFWVIKHGVKMTAMPAWGRTHGDDLIWDIVAFARRLPSMSAADYQGAIKTAPDHHDEIMTTADDHGHDPGEGHDHDH